MPESTSCGLSCQCSNPAPARPEPPWPPLAPIRRALHRAYRRLHAQQCEDRPSLTDPRSYLGLFPFCDLTALARSGYWPLPPRALAWLAEPPLERTRRRRRWSRRIEAVVRDMLAAELPEAVALLLRRAAS
jgi:hypothetical protein